MKRAYAKLHKYFFKLFLLPKANGEYVDTPAVFESIVSADPKKLFIITVAFNDVELVDLQNRALKKYILDAYEYFVIDNSKKPEASEAIKKYCVEHRINYIRLPLNNPGLDGSLHHGFALNWIYRNVVERFKPAEFAFVDTDLFPIASVRIGDYLAQGDAWGVLAEEYSWRTLWRHRSRIWIGLACFRRSRFDGEGRYPNFLPTWGMDTGGRIPIDVAALKKLPDVPHSVHSPLITIAPNITAYHYASFVHFANSWAEAPNALAVKKQWIESTLR